MYCSQEAGDKEGHLVEISDNVENNFILNFLNQIKGKYTYVCFKTARNRLNDHSFCQKSNWMIR